MSADDGATTVQAWVADAAGAPLRQRTIALPALSPNDVEVRVLACSLCHSDLHLLDGEWSSARFPLVPGHEVVGRVVRRGVAVRSPAVGALVGIGWQCGACDRCPACLAGLANLCTGGKRRTCVDQPGGFAERVRADARFAVELPDGLDPAAAAPLCCAGLTVYAALERLVSPGMQVGVIGMGGLGHLAVQFARAMGASVVVFDPDPTKRADARALGAAGFAGSDATSLDEWKAAAGAGFGVLLSTTQADLEWDRWLGLLAIGGTLCLVGVPAGPLSFVADHLIDGQKRITGGAIGTPEQLAAMFAFAVRHGIAARVERWPMSRVNEAFAHVRAGRARYRVTLEAADSRLPSSGEAG